MSHLIWHILLRATYIPYSVLLCILMCKGPLLCKIHTPGVLQYNKIVSQKIIKHI